MSTVNKHHYQAYASATQTVAKTQQIIMLYDGTISIIQQAKEAIREGRIEDRYHLLMKASFIIHGLQGCLDFESGKEIADVLYSFYASIENRLFSVHRTNNIDTCDAVINDLKQMRDAWFAIDQSTLPATAEQALTEASAGEVAAPTENPQNITLSA